MSEIRASPAPTLPQVDGAFRSGAVYRDPHAVYRLLRETAPVYWSPYLRQWLVTSFELVEEVLRQPRRFSSFGFDTSYIAELPADSRSEVSTLEHHFQQRGLIQADPPEHTRLRRALGPSFAANVVGELEATIRGVIDQLLADTEHELELIRDLAGPLPVRVIAELLGVDEEHRGSFTVWSADAVSFFGTPTPRPAAARRLDADLVEWRGLLTRLLDERRSARRDDLLTTVAGLVDTGVITHEEALFTCVHLLIAGHETTTNLIGNTMFCLLTHPDQLALVADDPALVPAAVEEELRFEPPIQRIRRVGTEPCELGGASIRAGDPVIPVLAAANRDPRRFAEPERFDILRKLGSSEQRHMAFGHGVHFCVGAPLARIEAPAAVGKVIERFPGLALAEGFVPDWRPTINLRGLRSLPVIARPAAVARR